MIDKADYATVRERLQELLAARLADVQVQVGDNIHYRGTNVVVTSPAFAGLLPEQRFHLVVRAIPKELYERHLRGGIVWFELAPDEAAQDYMKMPRSEDIAEHESAILARLQSIQFAEKLQARFNEEPETISADNLTATRQILTQAGLNKEDLTRACLFLIRLGGFCDVQVIADVIPEITKEHAA